LVKASRGSKGRREAGEEKNYENNLLSSPASSASRAYPNHIEGYGGRNSNSLLSNHSPNSRFTQIFLKNMGNCVLCLVFLKKS